MTFTDVLFGLFGPIIFLLVIWWALKYSKPQRREMTGAERMAYETERGKLQAQSDWDREQAIRRQRIAQQQKAIGNIKKSLKRAGDPFGALR